VQTALVELMPVVVGSRQAADTDANAPDRPRMIRIDLDDGRPKAAPSLPPRRLRTTLD
jgi:hypothetical protein